MGFTNPQGANLCLVSQGIASDLPAVTLKQGLQRCNCDIWRAVNLMLKPYGKKALEESTLCAPDDLAVDGDHDDAVTWRRITDEPRFTPAR